MNRKIIEECVRAAHDGSRKFPEIVGTLVKEGVESYHVDLIRAENRYYDPDGESCLVATGLCPPTPAGSFTASAVAAAVRKSQAGQITYQDFIQEIAGAGVVYYIAYLKGKRVVYMGREGDSHTEFFPGPR